METWKNSQEVPKKWANKFSKLLIRGFKQCWDFPGWDSHHLHQQLLDPLLGPWLIPNCTAQVGFSGGFSCWLLEDILHHFRGSLSEFIPWFTRFFFLHPTGGAVWDFWTINPVSLFFPVLGDLIVLDLLQVLDIPYRWTGWGKKWIVWEKSGRNSHFVGVFF